ncbi:unnamed protein product, partial [Brenthis ino]
MGESSKSLRIDWFDGSVTQETRPNHSQYLNEEISKPKPQSTLRETEKKPIGFKRLLDLSLLKPPILNLELSNRRGFWYLFNGNLKGDFIVLLVKIISSVYKSLEPNDTSKITTLLIYKFQKSNFLFQLKDYLNTIPKVKTVDKRMNMQLWDDVESFYFLVLDLCVAIFKSGLAPKIYLEQLYDILEVAEVSAIKVQENHMEPIREKFYQQLHQAKIVLNQSISPFMEEVAINTKQITPEETYIMNNFRNLDIFPNRKDLLEDKNVQIEPNLIDGAYPTVMTYLDLQFKLLREDCYGPLREGLTKYMANPSNTRYENIRVYPKVRVIQTYASRNKVGYLVDIAWNERLNNKSVNLKKYASNKWLMCGSLLLFTSDNFQNILFASVLDSNLDLLSQGYITVTFQNPVPHEIFSEQYLMVESEVFFEPYHRVLKVLQTLPSNDLPMKRYILDVQKETMPPAYLKSGKIYSILNQNNKEILFSAISDSWPSEKHFGLDKSQMEAYKFALSKEFAVIQGPPGTGKTFLGIKVASTLLRNLSLIGTPMLIICYTNHALDQFLEGIIKVTSDVIRLGHQSKSKILNPYNLHNMRIKMKSRHSHLYAKKRSELNSVFKNITDVQSDIEMCDKEILTYKTIKSYLNRLDRMPYLKCFNEDAILTWLFGHLDRVDDLTYSLDNWEKQYEDFQITDKIESCFSEKWALKEIKSMQNSINYVKNIEDINLQSQSVIRKFEMEIEKIKKRLQCFKKYMATLYNKKKGCLSKMPIVDLYKLSTDERWQLYFNWVALVKDHLMIKMNLLVEKHNELSRELDDISTTLDTELMQTIRVVGVTTTVAARRRDLMNKLKSPIVIVEEAAEVLEAHIVASITYYCQHLILIGDHKQLRPTAAHYILAKHYNMEISLFERMIRNGVHARTLTTQRRMRKNFMDLLVPTIYDYLDCHPTVLDYPPVKGMKDTLFFYNHNVFEDSKYSKESWSHVNTFEAKWSASLANYLRKMKYEAHEITILTTYNGQVSIIEEISKKYPLLRNVKITVVDNYQGEENRIVILSLVRSNKDRNIGFLSTSNRICVALSRAKEGFYMFGNMEVLQSASPIWRAIHEKLKDQKAIGSEIALELNENQEKVIAINNTLTNIAELDSCGPTDDRSTWDFPHEDLSNLSLQTPDEYDVMFEDEVNSSNGDSDHISQGSVADQLDEETDLVSEIAE